MSPVWFCIVHSIFPDMHLFVPCFQADLPEKSEGYIQVFLDGGLNQQRMGVSFKNFSSQYTGNFLVLLV